MPEAFDDKHHRPWLGKVLFISVLIGIPLLTLYIYTHLCLRIPNLLSL